MSDREPELFSRMPETVSRLSLALERGFSALAARELRALTADPGADRLERAGAALSLARWAYLTGDLSLARELTETVPNLLGDAEAFEGQGELRAICLTRAGLHAQALEVLESLRPRSEAEAAGFLLLRALAQRGRLEAEGRSPAEAEAAHLAGLNQVLTGGGLRPLAKRDRGRPLGLDNLSAPEARPGSVHGPLVSILMPAYNADPTIVLALESLLAQTYADFEIIAVDDDSQDQTREILAEAQKKDPRVRWLGQKVNSGAYRARNLALAAARGQLVTVHDSDDWAHPQKLETLVRVLLSEPKAVAARGRMVRVNQGLENNVNWRPTAGPAIDPSSLIFSRNLLDQIGAWDDSRASADSELADRIQRRFGPGAIVEISESPFLSLALSGPASLTRSPGTGLMSMAHAAGARFHYFQAYRHWHLKELAEGRPLDLRNKKFTAPPVLRPERPADSDYDLVLIAEFSRSAPPAPTERILNTARGRIAIFHWPRYQDPGSVYIRESIYDLCFERGIDILSSADRARAKLLLIDPAADLEQPLDALPAIEADRAEINHPDGRQACFQDISLGRFLGR